MEKVVYEGISCVTPVQWIEDFITNVGNSSEESISLFMVFQFLWGVTFFLLQPLLHVSASDLKKLVLFLVIVVPNFFNIQGLGY